MIFPLSRGFWRCLASALLTLSAFGVGLPERKLAVITLFNVNVMSLTQLDDDIVRTMFIGAVFSDFGGKINSIDFHRTSDLLVTASDDDSVRLYDIVSAKIVSLCMSPINDSFMSGSLDHSVRIWDLRVNSCQGILRLRGRPAVAYDQQGLVFAVAMEGGAVKLFDSRSYDKGPFDTFLVGGDTAEVCDIKFSNDGKSMLLTTTNNNVYVLDAYAGEKRCGFSLEPSHNTTIEATFTPDGQYVVAGSGDGSLHAWDIKSRSEIGRWSSHIGVASCLKWAPRRVMFVAASSVLTFWIPNHGKITGESNAKDADAATKLE
uniref:Uncharacterized protein n=1 Tax=Chenopodium quinoa TaxID=63459 RepID=A0A803MSE2_CHEQI